jgi:hypothetical protein
MKKQFTGTVEYKEVEYDYTAVIYTDNDAHSHPDQITDLDRSDREPLDEELWEEDRNGGARGSFGNRACELGWRNDSNET